MKNEAISNPDEAIAKVGQLIKGIPIAMLTTATADATLRSRPMAVQEMEFHGDLWFFCGADSAKVYEVRQEAHVNVSFADPSASRYVSLSGRATLVRDLQKAKELWNPTLKAWFPKGLDDPELALLKVTIDSAEFWDAPSGKMVQLVGMVKAAITGQPYKPGPGEHQKVNV